MGTENAYILSVDLLLWPKILTRVFEQAVAETFLLTDPLKRLGQRVWLLLLYFTLPN